MKVWIISREADYGKDVVAAVRTDTDAVTAWLKSKCTKHDCALRHDQWRSEKEAPLHPALNPAVVCDDSVRAEYYRARDEWLEQFCLSTHWAYDVEEWDTDE